LGTKKKIKRVCQRGIIMDKTVKIGKKLERIDLWLWEIIDLMSKKSKWG